MGPDKDGRWWPKFPRIGYVTARKKKVQIWFGGRLWDMKPEHAEDLAEILKAAAEETKKN